MDDILNFNFFNSRNLDAGEENLEYDIWEKHKFDETSIFTEKLKGLIDSNIRGPSYQQDSNCHSKVIILFHLLNLLYIPIILLIL